MVVVLTLAHVFIELIDFERSKCEGVSKRKEIESGIWDEIELLNSPREIE